MFENMSHPGKRFALWLIIGVTILNGIAVCSAYTLLNELKEKALLRAETKGLDLARAAARSAEGMVDKIDISLRMTVSEIERSSGGALDGWERVSYTVSRQFDILAESDNVSVTDADGNVVIHEGQSRPATFNVRDRAYFEALKSGRHSGLYVSEVLSSRLSKRPSIVFARAYRKPDGTFGGLVAIPVDVEHFRRLVAGYAIGPNDLLSLRLDDLSLIVREPPGINGSRLEAGSTANISNGIMGVINKNGQNATIIPFVNDKNTNMAYAYSRVKNAQMYAISGISTVDFLNRLSLFRKATTVGLLVFFFLTSLTAWVLYRFWRRQWLNSVSLFESNAQLRLAFEEVRERDDALLAAREVGGLGTFSIDLTGNVWTSSPEQEAIFGIDKTFPHSADGWKSLLHPGDLSRAFDYHKDAIQSGKRVLDVEYRVIRPSDGAVRWIHSIGKLDLDQDGVPLRITGAVKDITEVKEAQRHMEYLAYHDSLTGLPNRTLLADRMQQALARAKRQGELLAVCYLDLDCFKPINDAWGHEVGDALLKEVASRLEGCTRAGDTVARIGGDEFVVLLCGLGEEAEPAEVTHRVQAMIAKPYDIAGKHLSLTMSMGLTVFPLDDADDADVLLRHADQAMYEAKRSGKNRVNWFDSESDRRQQENQARYARIVSALEDGEFCLHYQPKVDLRTGAPVSVEALIRWRHPERGLLLPGSFLPGVERTDFTKPLGDWVLRQALRQQRIWRGQGVDIRVSVNIFGHHLQQADFIAHLEGILAEFPDIPVDRLVLEILETTAMHDLDVVSQRLRECARLGLDFALDDFGTGYSSLTYFRRLPVAFLKIDRSFVAGLLSNPEDHALVESIVAMAHALDRKVIAEGVETIDHGVPLLRFGCDLGQGFGISPPMPPEDVPAWIGQWRMPAAWETARVQ